MNSTLRLLVAMLLLMISASSVLAADDAVVPLKVRRDYAGRFAVEGYISTDAQMALLEQHPEVQRMHVIAGRQGMTNAGMASLRKLPKLEVLRVSSANAAGLEAIRGHQSLLEVALLSAPLDDKVLDVLSSLPKLDTLTMYYSGDSRGEVWEFVAKHPTLRRFRIGNHGLAKSDFEAFERFTNLRSLHINSEKFDPPTLRKLRAALPQTVVTNQHTSYSVEDLRAVSQSIETDSAGNLVAVNQASGRATDEKLAVLSGFLTIVRLKLWGELSDGGLQTLSRLKNLEEFELRSETLTDAGLAHLHALKKLRRLDLRAPKVTAAGIEKLKSELPDCEIVVRSE